MSEEFEQVKDELELLYKKLYRESKLTISMDKNIDLIKTILEGNLEGLGEKLSKYNISDELNNYIKNNGKTAEEALNLFYSLLHPDFKRKKLKKRKIDIYTGAIGNNKVSEKNIDDIILSGAEELLGSLDYEYEFDSDYYSGYEDFLEKNLDKIKEIGLEATLLFFEKNDNNYTNYSDDFVSYIFDDDYEDISFENIKNILKNRKGLRILKALGGTSYMADISEEKYKYVLKELFENEKLLKIVEGNIGFGLVEHILLNDNEKERFDRLLNFIKNEKAFSLMEYVNVHFYDIFITEGLDTHILEILENDDWENYINMNTPGGIINKTFYDDGTWNINIKEEQKKYTANQKK